MLALYQRARQSSWTQTESYYCKTLNSPNLSDQFTVRNSTLHIQLGLCDTMNCTVDYPLSANNKTMDSLWYITSTPNYDLKPYFSDDPVVGRTEKEGRYKVIGNLSIGDCSFRLDRARQIDDGKKLYLRVRGKSRKNKRINCLFSLEYFLVRTLPLSEKPTIMHSILYANRPVKFICTAPGKCKGLPIPIIRWSGSLSGIPTIENTTTYDDWSATYSSSYVIQGSLADNGKLLKCFVSLDDGDHEVSSTVTLNFIGLALTKALDVAAGVIDQDFRGNVAVLLVNHAETPYVVKPGDRIA
uniref:Sialic acid-binding Ig-like lectin 8 n=1 Tax=Geotrypetes seraphini TaxID=260995 RepID=A0A6P8SVI4_GEOSA|nr:sialic acid-binding Ig-like lectin 8 [Geotrypetes seraphini]